MRIFKLLPPIVFDTDCLSSFLKVRHPDLIAAVLGGSVLLPEQVVYELDNLKPTKYAWLPQILEKEIAAGGNPCPLMIFPRHIEDLTIIFQNDRVPNLEEWRR